MSYHLAPARPADAVPCARILRDWIAETDWFTSPNPPTADRTFVAARIADDVVVVARYHGHVAGFLAIEQDFVRCLYVDRLHRNRRLGKDLLDYAKSVRRSGLQLWTFQANSAARGFYEREGFVKQEETDGHDNEEGLPDIRYVWPAPGQMA